MATTYKYFKVRSKLRREKGQAMLFAVALLGTITIFAASNFFSLKNVDLENNRQTEIALAKAREALIGYAVANTTRPGNLPCPDRTNSGQQTTPCNSLATRIGLLPWRTLGTENLRDSTGAPLLYAVSDVYRRATGILNSDTAGDYTVAGTTPASGVIAIVFAPGPSTGFQRRDAAAALCSTTGTTVARNVCPANYLEAGNEDGDANFISALPSATFNDKLLLIMRDTLFPAVTTRVAREIRSLLNDFYSANNRFPDAALFSDSTSTCSPSAIQGRLALASITGCVSLPPYPALGSPPSWFFNNNWQDHIFYAVSSPCTSAATAAACATTGGLTVSGASTNTRSLLIISGRALNGQARPCTTLSDCFEDAENINADNVFKQPALSTSNNDRLVIVAP